MICIPIRKTAIALGALVAIASPTFAQTGSSTDAPAGTPATETPTAQAAPVAPPQAEGTIQQEAEFAVRSKHSHRELMQIFQ